MSWQELDLSYIVYIMFLTHENCLINKDMDVPFVTSQRELWSETPLHGILKLSAMCNCNTALLLWAHYVSSFPTQTLYVGPPTYSAVCVFPVGLKVLLHLEPQSNKKGEALEMAPPWWLSAGIPAKSQTPLQSATFKCVSLCVICFPTFFGMFFCGGICRAARSDAKPT